MNWYRFSELKPPLVAKVRVWWEGREFVAARALHPDTGKDAWAEYKLKSNGKPSEDASPVKLDAAPELWAPLQPDLWKLALPEPVTLSAAGRMVAERTRFALVEEAEVADLAREMERDRADAARGASQNGVSRETMRETIQWWRISTGIQYLAAPDMTLKMVEWRLMRAIYNCGADNEWGAKAPNKLREITAELALAMRGLAESEAAQSPDIIPRMQSSPSDEGDFPIAMDWFTALYPPEQRPSYWARIQDLRKFNRAQRVLIWRALNVPWSFAEIGAEIKLSGERARQIFDEAIGDAFKFANGLPQRKGVPKRIDHIAMVRETNRRVRRRASA